VQYAVINWIKRGTVIKSKSVGNPVVFQIGKSKELKVVDEHVEINTLNSQNQARHMLMCC